MGHVAGSEGWLGHYLTSIVPGLGECFHFTWGLERKQGPCICGRYVLQVAGCRLQVEISL